MDFHSDFSRINSLLDTNEMSDLEFSENPKKIDGQWRSYSNANDTADTNFHQVNLDTNNRYAQKQERGYYRQDLLSDAHGGNKGQFGGFNDNYMNMNGNTTTQKNSQNKPQNLDNYEKDFFAIFNKAREYRKRVLDVQKQMGGEDKPKEKPKRKLNATLALILEMSKKMLESKKYPGIQYKNLMKISKAILDDVRREEGTKEITEKVRKLALQRAENPDQYIKQFQENQQGMLQLQSLNNVRSNERRNKSNSIKNEIQKEIEWHQDHPINAVQMKKRNQREYREEKNKPWQNNNNSGNVYSRNVWKNNSSKNNSSKNKINDKRRSQFY